LGCRGEVAATLAELADAALLQAVSGLGLGVGL